MEIRDPMYKPNDYVVNGQGIKGFVVRVENYNFDDNEYTYIVKTDETFIDEPAFISEDEYNLEPYQEKPKAVWDLKEGDEFYYIAFDGDILSGKWVDAIEYRESGNVFLTLQEAESELERRKIEAEMLRLGGRRNFKKGESNWYIRYNFYTDSVDVDYNMYDSYGRGIIYFDSEEKAKEIIKTISEDKIRKYIFGAD